MMDRFELKDKLNEVLNKSPRLSAREWEEEFINLYEECDTRILIEECLEEAIYEKYGETAFIEMFNKVGKDAEEIKNAENGTLDEELTPEQEQLLNDLF